jgi:hypothetical protein
MGIPIKYNAFTELGAKIMIKILTKKMGCINVSEIVYNEGMYHYTVENENWSDTTKWDLKENDVL